MNMTEILTAAETMSEQGGAELILEEVLRALPTDQAEEILRFIATNWDYDVPELFDEDEDEGE